MANIFTTIEWTCDKCGLVKATDDIAFFAHDSETMKPTGTGICKECAGPMRCQCCEKGA